jgi:AraC family transcriptional activator FtrA
VAVLARHAVLAPRRLARRFAAETGTSPLRWLTAQCVLAARRLLETTDDPMDRVAERSGLGSAANLRILLTRDVGLSTTAYRRAYRAESVSY